VKNSFANITDSDFYIHSVLREPLEYAGLWGDGQPNGGDLVNCATTTGDRKWETQECSSKYALT